MKKLKLLKIPLTIWTLLLFLVSSLPLYSQSDGNYGTTMNISYGAGARAMGLGRAYVSIANDATAMFWNPAGLELVPRTTFTLFHHQIFEGTIYDYAGFVYPTLTYGTIGIGLARLGTGEIIMRDEFNVNIGKMNYEEDELYFSYGKKLPWNILAGFTFKLRRQSFTGVNEEDTSPGFDAGFMYRPGWDDGIFANMAFGFSYRNLLSPNLRLGQEADQEPAHLTFGMVKGLRAGETGIFNLVVDLRQSKYESVNLLFGTEYVFQDLGTIRVGLDNMNLAFGAGVKYSFVQIDYSFGSTISDGEFPPTHRFSITFDIGKSREELFTEAEQERLQREAELVASTKEAERQNVINESMELGKEYLAEGKYFDAYSEFQQVISLEPFDTEANILLDSARTLMDRDITTEQDSLINVAIDKELAQQNAELIDQYFNRGQDYLNNKRFTDALVQFNSALELAPDNPTIINAIERTNRIRGEEVRKLVDKGREQFSNGNYSDALQTLSDAMVLSPEDPKLKEEINTLANRIKIQQYTSQALQLFDLGRYEEALQLFEEALEMDPTNQALQNYVNRTKRGMGTEVKEMAPEDERRYIEGVDLFLSGKYQQALTIWRELEQEYPYNKKLQDAIKNAEDRMKKSGSR
jgi:tetratricopeptide (TPR) repeat protein